MDLDILKSIKKFLLCKNMCDHSLEREKFSKHTHYELEEFCVLGYNLGKSNNDSSSKKKVKSVTEKIFKR